MTNKEFVLDSLRKSGEIIALSLQENADTMTGTELNEEAVYIPDFKAAVAKTNMLDRPVGFVCKSTAGRVVKLLQVYDSTVFTAEPEELPAQWGFVWSKDPAHALPFIAISTSPYMTGDVVLFDNQVWRSTIDNNVWTPTDYPAGWELAE